MPENTASASSYASSGVGGYRQLQGNAKTINNDPEKYFTEDVMKQLEEFAEKEFRYGNDS